MTEPLHTDDVGISSDASRLLSRVDLPVRAVVGACDPIDVLAACVEVRWRETRLSVVEKTSARVADSVSGSRTANGCDG